MRDFLFQSMYEVCAILYSSSFWLHRFLFHRLSTVFHVLVPSFLSPGLFSVGPVKGKGRVKKWVLMGLPLWVKTPHLHHWIRETEDILSVFVPPAAPKNIAAFVVAAAASAIIVVVRQTKSSPCFHSNV